MSHWGVVEELEESEEEESEEEEDEEEEGEWLDRWLVDSSRVGWLTRATQRTTAIVKNGSSSFCCTCSTERRQWWLGLSVVPAHC